MGCGKKGMKPKGKAQAKAYLKKSATKKRATPKRKK